MTQLSRPLATYEAYHVVWSSDGREFFGFWASQLLQSGPQTRFIGCCGFSGRYVHSLPPRTFTQGKEVWFAYVERKPQWWGLKPEAAEPVSKHAK